MKTKLLLPLLLLIIACEKDDAGNKEETKLCEVNNTSTINLYNTTTNIWWYKIPDQTGSIVSNIPAGFNDSVNVEADTYYEVTWYYPFTYDGVEYQWNVASKDHLGFYQCSVDETSISSNCDTQNTGFIVYANNTSVPITISVDGSSYAPIQPGDVKGYEVASGVAHNVNGTSAQGTYSLSPSVGKCQRLATVLN